MDDLARAGCAVDARIKELGMTYRAVAARAGCDPSTLWKVRTGDESVSSRVRERVSEVLGWPADTVDRMTEDPSFDPPATGATDSQRIAALEQAVEELQQRLRKLEG